MDNTSNPINQIAQSLSAQHLVFSVFLAFIVLSYLGAPRIILADLPNHQKSPTRLDTLGKLEKTIVQVAQKTKPAVVFIGGGSGVCISEEGILLTNDHVVGGKKRHLVYFSQTGLRCRAQLLGRFPAGDIALLKIEEEGTYPFLELGNSDELVPGERVLALGNPFLLAVDNNFFGGVPADFHPSISLGVISALHRNSPPRYPDAIQVDVAVNPGNSGGPLISLNGKVVGINGKIETRLHLSVNSGVGYAIPSNQISRFLEPLKNAKGSLIHHGRIPGIEVENRVLPDKPGLGVKKVKKGSHAENLGFHSGDRILTIDNYSIPTKFRFDGLLQTYPVGSQIKVNLLREGQQEELLITLISLKIELGLKFYFDEQIKGILKVKEISPNSPAERAGIRTGDIIKLFDKEVVTTRKSLSLKIKSKKRGDVVIIKVLRDKKERDIPVLLQIFDVH